MGKSLNNKKKNTILTGRNSPGITLLEVVVVMSIIIIIVTGILPLSQVTYKRTKEMELRRNLRIIRTAIDKYKDLYDAGEIPMEGGSNGYPKTLQVLMEGVNTTQSKGFKKKFLRRIPKDPFEKNGEWGKRSYSDEFDSETWGEQDLYDVYSKSDKQALDKSYYKDW